MAPPILSFTCRPLPQEFGMELDLDIFNRLSKETPHLVNLRPGGPHRMLDLDRAGGIQAVLSKLKPKLNLDVLTVTGRTLGDELEDLKIVNPETNAHVIASLDKPVHAEGGIAILREARRQRDVWSKQTAVSPKMMMHTGPAVV